MRTSWIIQVGLNPMTSVLISNKHGKDSGKDHVKSEVAKECLWPPEAGRSKEQNLP